MIFDLFELHVITGTLTRQGLDFVSARCRSKWAEESRDLDDDDLLVAMSCCHNLTLSRKSGDLIGNPVDCTMFASSGASLLGGNQNGSSSRSISLANGKTVSIEKQFDFDHHRMTQSVICKMPDGSIVAFVKGSGESVQQICTPESLPSDFDSSIRQSAKSGTYQISFAKKTISPNTDMSKISRDEVEDGLSFVGVINFKNVLRDETPETIRHLEAGGVHCIMATGDNMLTGITIAREAGMIKQGCKVLYCSSVPNGNNEDFQWIDESSESPADLPPLEQLATGTTNIELAVTGSVWQALMQRDIAVAASMASSIRVYGRCTPYDKVSIVSTLVDMGYKTIFAGDGANDTGALKTAHVGVALSDAEASIVSPFTSIDKSIESVVHIIREGRCALASAFASYKYISKCFHTTLIFFKALMT